MQGSRHARSRPARAQQQVTAGWNQIRFRRLISRIAAHPAAQRRQPDHRIAASSHGKQLHIKAAAALSVDATTETRTSTTEEETQYVWTRNWWPLIPINYLDPKRPKALTVLGVQLVVWRDGEGQWKVFKDACPHRLAPLSEGRVEADGTLLCSYHAWRFNGEGKCTSIPQSVTTEAEATARTSRRSCAVAFPTQEEVGILWVWPDESDSRWIEAAGTPVIVSNLIKQRHAELQHLPWYMRDLPYGYEVLVENVTDPAHVQVSHHGLAPQLSRYTVKPMNMFPTPDPSQMPIFHTPIDPEFSLSYNSPYGPQRNAMVRFTAPLHVQICTTVQGSWLSLISLYCLPVGPGKSRVIHLDQRNLAAAGTTGAMSMYTRWMANKLFNPVFVHRSMNRLFDGDGVFLNMQETTLQQQHRGDWRKAYYLPAPCDRAVVAARSWIEKAGHPFPTEMIGVQGPVVDRRLLLDRYESHTTHCPTCQAEVKRLTRLVGVAKVVAAACFLLACTIAGSVGWAGLVKNTAPFITNAGAGVAALLAAVVGSLVGWISKLEEAKSEFFFTDWIHADKD